MKKNNTVKQSLQKGTNKTKKIAKGAQESITIGMDLGDKANRSATFEAPGKQLAKQSDCPI